ncbi:MAG: hypothetical protein Q7K33_00945 [Candidatus Berkelbacteria bacterium]|nr:hypothetical protein [Candidatus Berkelbacteria bacterium]
MVRKVLAFDFDGVIIDFFGHFRVFANDQLGTNVSNDECLWHDLGKCFGVDSDRMRSVHEKWETTFSHDVLQPIDGALESLAVLSSRYDIAIVTSRKRELETVTRDWFEKSFPQASIHFAMGRNNPYAGADGRLYKPQVAELIGAIALVEDNEEEFVHWDSSSVEPICFAHPWNECLIETHPHILRLRWPQIMERFLG